MNRTHDLAEGDKRLILRDSARPIAACQALPAQGTYAQSIRPPTVREETVRLPLTAAHRPFHVKRALDALHRDDLLPLRSP